MSHAEEIARSLKKAKQFGKVWVACCPAHNDSNPSLQLSDGNNGQLLLHCFTGCDWQDVMTALKLGKNYTPTASKPSKPPKAGDFDTRLRAYKLWKETRPAKDTIVETYMQSRGYFGVIPADIRFHPSLYHSPSKTYFPAMVAKVTRYHDDILLGIHRTYLAKDGKGKADIANNKMMLGNVAGGAVQLGTLGKTLIVGEGLETVISAQNATGITSWAALSTSGMKSLILPPLNIIGSIIIAADHDTAGVKAAHECAEKWYAQGRKVQIALPPKGKDFNDLLKEENI
ncbi:MAG: toprim domain-containing protein [Pseudomonadota bacterium]